MCLLYLPECLGPKAARPGVTIVFISSKEEIILPPSRRSLLSPSKPSTGRVLGSAVGTRSRHSQDMFSSTSSVGTSAALRLTGVNPTLEMYLTYIEERVSALTFKVYTYRCLPRVTAELHRPGISLLCVIKTCDLHFFPFFSISPSFLFTQQVCSF